MASCLNCGTELTQLAGKRKKVFCDSTCRSNYWQKQKRKTSTFVKPLKTNQNIKNPSGSILDMIAQEEALILNKKQK